MVDTPSGRMSSVLHTVTDEQIADQRCERLAERHFDFRVEQKMIEKTVMRTSIQISGADEFLHEIRVANVPCSWLT